MTQHRTPLAAGLAPGTGIWGLHIWPAPVSPARLRWPRPRGTEATPPPHGCGGHAQGAGPGVSLGRWLSSVPNARPGLCETELCPHSAPRLLSSSAASEGSVPPALLPQLGLPVPAPADLGWLLAHLSPQCPSSSTSPGSCLQCSVLRPGAEDTATPTSTSAGCSLLMRLSPGLSLYWGTQGGGHWGMCLEWPPALCWLRGLGWAGKFAFVFVFVFNM